MLANLFLVRPWFLLIYECLVLEILISFISTVVWLFSRHFLLMFTKSTFSAFCKPLSKFIEMPVESLNSIYAVLSIFVCLAIYLLHLSIKEISR